MSLNQIYAEARKREDDSERKAETADKTVVIRTLLWDLTLEEAKKEAKSARDELEKAKIWRRKVQKRALLLSEIVMKEDNAEVQTLGKIL